MTVQSACPLCSAVAAVEARAGGWQVTCPLCLRFTLDPYLMDLFQSARRLADARILRLLPRLSSAAQQIAADGGRLHLTAETWQAASDSAADK